jgi:hypothetical protein
MLARRLAPFLPDLSLPEPLKRRASIASPAFAWPL